jgi:hypothetical protein
MTKKEKILEWSLAFALGGLLPILSIYLVVTSCPSVHDETFALPLMNTQCTGELIGQIGLFIVGLPLVVTFLLAIFTEFFLFQAVWSHGNIIIIFVGFAYLLGSLVNILFYWSIIRSSFYLRQKIKASLNPPTLIG